MFQIENTTTKKNQSVENRSRNSSSIIEKQGSISQFLQPLYITILVFSILNIGGILSYIVMLIFNIEFNNDLSYDLIMQIFGQIIGLLTLYFLSKPIFHDTWCNQIKKRKNRQHTLIIAFKLFIIGFCTYLLIISLSSFLLMGLEI